MAGVFGKFRHELATCPVSLESFRPTRICHLQSRFAYIIIVEPGRIRTIPLAISTYRRIASASSNGCHRKAFPRCTDNFLTALPVTLCEAVDTSGSTTSHEALVHVSRTSSRSRREHGSSAPIEVSDTVGYHQDDTHLVLGTLVLFRAFTALLCYRCPTLASMDL